MRRSDTSEVSQSFLTDSMTHWDMPRKVMCDLFLFTSIVLFLSYSWKKTFTQEMCIDARAQKKKEQQQEFFPKFFSYFFLSSIWSDGNAIREEETNESAISISVFSNKQRSWSHTNAHSQTNRHKKRERRERTRENEEKGSRMNETTNKPK